MSNKAPLKLHQDPLKSLSLAPSVTHRNFSKFAMEKSQKAKKKRVQAELNIRRC
jgi:hypothetical protein